MHFNFGFRQKLVAFVFPLILALPFLNRAYFVDDSYFVEIGQWLKEHPQLPYHFRTDDAGLQNRGWEETGLVRMVNPLVHHYYLAVLLKLGKAEWFLRLGGVLLTSGAALFLFGLARRLTPFPLLATLLTLATPAVWLTSYSLLIDSTLFFMFLGGLYYFIRGRETNSMGAYMASGVFMGGAILTKYPGLFILPLTLLWFFLNRQKSQKISPAFLSWGLALLMLLGYSWYTSSLYGEPHILAASKRMVRVFTWPKLLVFFIFFSGTTLVPMLAWNMVGAKKALVSGLGVFCLALLFSSKLGGYPLSQALLIGFWVLTSALFLYLIWSKKNILLRKDGFLIGWVLGFIGMMLLVMDWVAARYYVIVVPGVIFLMVRLAEIFYKREAQKWLKGSWVCLLIFTSLLAYSDYKQAEPGRQIGPELMEKGYRGGPGYFYMGDSFTMSYLKGYGWTPAFRGTTFKKGDKILSKEVTMPPIWPWWKNSSVAVLDTFEFPTCFPLKVMDYNGSAGFYASVWGGLPFTFSREPWERFRVYEVVESF